MRLVRVVLLAVAIGGWASTCIADAAPESSKAIDARSSSDDVYAAIKQSIDNIRSMREGYSKKILGKQSEQAGFDSSIILLGLGSVAAALYRSSVPALGGIALAAGAASQYRAYYNPEGVGSAYIKAVRAARCVSTSAEPLLIAQPQNVWNQIATLRLAAADVGSAASQLTGATPAQGDGSDAASKALASANTALTALNAEAGAYNSAPAAIDQAHDAIKNFIDQSSHRTGVDYGSVQTALTNGITAAANSAAQVQTARSQLIDAIKAQAKAQVSSGNTAEKPAPQVQAPANLAMADSVRVTAPTGQTGATATKENADAVSALIAATTQALQQMPNPQYTSTLTSIAACTAGLS